MNIKGNRIISEKNVFRRIAALLTTLLLVITVIPEGFSTTITSVAEAADTAVTGAYFDTDGMKIVTYNVVNDFGADNTGNAMTGKQIQQALDAAQENSGQGIFTKVVIPKGTYLISSALVVYSDTWIYCEEGVEIKRCISYGPMLRCDNNGIGGYDEREQTLNQLLSEMDGFDGSKGVVILAATNRPESLDPALLRPGRFDRRIPVELPDLKGREDILKVHAAKIKIADNVDFNAIARTAAGASGAELANIVNEAALRAVRDGRKFATQTDLMESVEVVIAGYQKKNRILSTKEKLIVSYHEVGHALVAALQTNSAPVQKITIIPRTSGALGFTMQVDEGEKYLMTKEELENKIATFTGGRVAEELVFGDVTTGASNDIEQATKLARAIITRYGMSEFGMVAMESLNNVYLGGDTSMSCSQETAAKIDDLVVALVQKQYEKAKNLLNSHMDKLHEISKFLYEHETITGEEFMEILNRPQIVAQD